jgi:hypothetical protein
MVIPKADFFPSWIRIQGVKTTLEPELQYMAVALPELSVTLSFAQFAQEKV